MSIPNDLLAEAVAGLLARIPEKWEPVPSDLAEHERQALDALIAAGLVERKITLSVRLPGQQERATIAIEITGEAGLAEAMEGACQDLWRRWGERWKELQEEVGQPRPIVEKQEDSWRLSSQGKIAKGDLESKDPLDRRRPIDFTLKRGFFDGTPKLLPDGRITWRKPVRGYGRLLRCQIENAPSGPLGVEVNNWRVGAEAFAKAFERFLQNLPPSPAPSPASGQAAPAQSSKQAEPDYVFRKEGEIWFIRAFEKEARFQDVNGFWYLYKLITSPKGGVRMVELVMEGSSASQETEQEYQEEMQTSRPDLLADQKAIKAAEDQLQEIKDRLNDPDYPPDWEEREKLEQEQEKLEEYLRSVQGFGGKPRKMADEVDTLRASIWSAIKRVFQRLKKQKMEQLAEHFESNLRSSGDRFCYDNRLPWAV